MSTAPESEKGAARETKSKQEHIMKPAKPKGPPRPTVQDPQAMFKEGFLAEVYQENPISSNGIKEVKTRFPPEPNGHLHIGHCKAIAINFGFARYHGGQCYLRFDDTNPEAEKDIFYKSIEESVRWLGYNPSQITYSSDHFDRLYELAEFLIKEDGAYVCYCSKSELEAQRGQKSGKARYACAHRDRPTAESLEEFRAMRDGKYGPHEASLRMKQDIDNDNPQMWDLTAYRVIAKEHHQTGGKWRIYPTYDFTHCLCDSFEGITHSLCTTEFELSRESYEWLCDKVKVYKPMQREYGRLSLFGVVTSKRKIMDLVEQQQVRGWDDPRLYTLNGLRRRGVPPGAMLAFINELGVTKATTKIEIKRFEQSVRVFLESTVPRLMLVMDPILVIIDNLPEDHLELLEVPFSKDTSFGVHTIPFTKHLYIDRSDFREIDTKDYFRLAPGKSVGLLKVQYPITATSFDSDPVTGLVTSVHARYEKPEGGVPSKKPKSYIQWVANSPIHQSPIRAEVRLFSQLFRSGDPEVQSVVDPQSQEVFPSAMLETGFREIQRSAPWPAVVSGIKAEQKDGVTASDATKGPPPESVRFQGMRVAYFCVDSDSAGDRLVLNRIVSLKEDARKA